MPTEVKQRKKTQAQKQSDEVSEVSPSNDKDEAQKVKTESLGVDVKSLLCFLSLVACGALSW